MAMAYPKRESHFAHKFVRLMFRCCLANELGPEACYMLSQIAHTEDAKRYRGPVTFYNEQLISVCGLANVRSLDRARKKAVEAGWLYYEPGHKRCPGKYFVLIPKHSEDVPDGSIESDLHPGFVGKNDIESARKPPDNRQESVEVTARKPPDNRQESAQPSSLFPIPNPDPFPSPNTDTSPNGDSPRRKNIYSAEFENWYSLYPLKAEKHKAAAAFGRALSRIQTSHQLDRSDALDWLCEVTTRFSASPKARGPYVPHPASWLNGGRYDDDQKTWQRSGDERVSSKEDDIDAILGISK